MTVYEAVDASWRIWEKRIEGWRGVNGRRWERGSGVAGVENGGVEEAVSFWFEVELG